MHTFIINTNFITLCHCDMLQPSKGSIFREYDSYISAAGSTK
jgi:hypothetical protein